MQAEVKERPTDEGGEQTREAAFKQFAPGAIFVVELMPVDEEGDHHEAGHAKAPGDVDGEDGLVKGSEGAGIGPVVEIGLGDMGEDDDQHGDDAEGIEIFHPAPGRIEIEEGRAQGRRFINEQRRRGHALGRGIERIGRVGRVTGQGGLHKRIIGRGEFSLGTVMRKLGAVDLWGYRANGAAAQWGSAFEAGQDGVA